MVLSPEMKQNKTNIITLLVLYLRYCITELILLFFFLWPRSKVKARVFYEGCLGKGGNQLSDHNLKIPGGTTVLKSKHLVKLKLKLKCIQYVTKVFSFRLYFVRYIGEKSKVEIQKQNLQRCEHI